MAVLEVEGVSKTFGSGEFAVHALKESSFAVAAGELAALLGPSGSGKSTLLLSISLILEPSTGRIVMNGREVYKYAVKNMAAAARTALEANGLTPADVAWVVAHQANLRILEGVADRVGIPMERFFTNVDRYGNTSSASVPTALDEALEQGKIKEGDILVLSALGGGLSWASAALRW